MAQTKSGGLESFVMPPVAGAPAWDQRLVIVCGSPPNEAGGEQPE